MIQSTLGWLVKQALAVPYFIFLMVIAAGLFLPRLQANARLARRFLIAGWLALVLFSIPLFPYFTLKWLEDYSPCRRVADYPVADVIFVAGGTARAPGLSLPEPEETGGNRLGGAARLFFKKRAPVIVVAGGGPYQWPPGSQRSQAKDMAEILIALGVPREAIWQQDRSINTEQDVHFSLPLFREKKIKKILAVTDAMHMRRLLYFFPKGEFDVTPVPVARQTAGWEWAWQSFVPSPGWLEEWNPILKELIGYLYARLFR